jgi:hypothetical protein
MSAKNSGINYSRLLPVKNRRSRVVSRLESQLALGTKNTKEGVKNLSEKDIKRINREISTLKERH